MRDGDGDGDWAGHWVVVGGGTCPEIGTGTKRVHWPARPHHVDHESKQTNKQTNPFLPFPIIVGKPSRSLLFSRSVTPTHLNGLRPFPSPTWAPVCSSSVLNLGAILISHASVGTSSSLLFLLLLLHSKDGPHPHPHPHPRLLLYFRIPCVKRRRE
jgi:hypothetical protein